MNGAANFKFARILRLALGCLRNETQKSQDPNVLCDQIVPRYLVGLAT